MTTAKEKDRENLIKIKEKSDDDFEKNITYISAGALGLSMTFIEKIINIPKAICFYLLIIAWGLLTITLLVNLLSHYLSSYYLELATEEFDNNDKNTNANIDRRNKRLRRINIGTIITLILGIIFLIIFLSINLYKMSNESEKTKTTIVSKPDSLDIEKLGRTATKPSTIKPIETDKSSGNSQTNTNNKKS